LVFLEEPPAIGYALRLDQAGFETSMIVCSCNVLTDSSIRACVKGEACPRTPGDVYKCLGCSPNCGRCFATVKSIIREALSAADAVAPACCDAPCGKTVSFPLEAERAAPAQA
jgi:bacterioferritin-associated ferredoxin